MGADGQPIRIDLETLRASTRAATDKENSQQQSTAGQKTSGNNHPSPPGVQSHTPVPQPQSLNASPVVATSKPSSNHPGRANPQPPPPTSGSASNPYAYPPLTSSSDVQSMSGQSVWASQPPRGYGEPAFSRAPHASEPRSTST